jgi:hypothetical protein
MKHEFCSQSSIAIDRLIDIVYECLEDWKSLNKPGNYQMSNELLEELNELMEHI